MTDEKCKFCNKIFPYTKIDKHISMHIKDCNTPAAVIRDGKYVCGLLENYSSYTLYGEICMLKKFIDIPFPSPGIFQAFVSTQMSSYQSFSQEFGYLKVMYYKMMDNNIDIILQNKDLALNNPHNILKVMNELWPCLGPDTYTERKYKDLLASINSQL